MKTINLCKEEIIEDEGLIFVKADGYLIFINVLESFTKNELIIPFNINGYLVKEIDSYNMKNKYIKEITFPNLNLTIYPKSFYGLENLEVVNISPLMENYEIFLEPFHKKLKKINVHKDNKNITSIDGVLFNKDKTVLIRYPINSDLKNYQVPEKVVTIKEYAFYKANVETITFNKNIRNIKHWAFADAKKLKELTWPKTVAVIEQFAFFSTHSLTNIVLPKTLEKIETAAFQDSKIKEIIIPKGVNRIDKHAFCMNEGLVIYHESTNLYANYYYDKTWFNGDIRVVYSYKNNMSNEILDYLQTLNVINKNELIKKHKIIDYNYNKIHNLKEIIVAEVDLALSDTITKYESNILLSSKNFITQLRLLTNQKLFKYQKIINKIRENDGLSLLFYLNPTLNKEIVLDQLQYLEIKYNNMNKNFFSFFRKEKEEKLINIKKSIGSLMELLMDIYECPNCIVEEKHIQEQLLLSKEDSEYLLKIINNRR